MLRTRLLFSKTGRAKYISHLDLMRTFQRVFMRAGVSLRHTEGFNPHPYMNFALPLSVGVDSTCELLDFDLVEALDLDTLPSILNKMMPEGIEAVRAYVPVTKFTEIAWLEVEGNLVYDNGIGTGTAAELTALYKSKELVIPKKSKKGIVDTDIIPLIYSMGIMEKNCGELTMRAVIKAQNPSLNPDNLIAAIQRFLPADAPDFVSFKRIEIYDDQHLIYR